MQSPARFYFCGCPTSRVRTLDGKMSKLKRSLKNLSLQSLHDPWLQCAVVQNPAEVMKYSATLMCFSYFCSVRRLPELELARANFWDFAATLRPT